MTGAGDLASWLRANAQGLDEGERTPADEWLPLLGASGRLRIGVPEALGGAGGSLTDAVEAIADVARESVTAAFVFWGQRAFIEYLVQSPNEGLRERALPGLLEGSAAGASGLSNAMKFLSGIEQLGVRASGAGPWHLDGHVPWATNLRAPNFSVALAVARSDGAPAMVVAVPSSRPGLRRSDDLDLVALRGSQTAALKLDAVPLDEADILHPDAQHFLPRVRPAFLGLQCALSIGLADAAIRAASERLGTARAVLEEPLELLQRDLARHRAEMLEGLADGRFTAHAPALFRLRIALADDVRQALQLELVASGGRAYHRDQPLGFARRWRESAFIPIVTPSLSQLQSELAKLALAA